MYYVRIPIFAVCMGLLFGGIAWAASQRWQFGLYVFGLTVAVLVLFIGTWIVRTFDSRGRPRRSA
jgi:hypothetical protein